MIVSTSIAAERWQTGSPCLRAAAAGARGRAPRCQSHEVSGGPPPAGIRINPRFRRLAQEDAAVLAPVAPEKFRRRRRARPRRRLPQRFTQPGAGDEADPLPVRREERYGCALRPRELRGGRLIQAADEQPRGIARGVGQPRAIGRDGDAAPSGWRGGAIDTSRPGRRRAVSAADPRLVNTPRCPHRKPQRDDGPSVEAAHVHISARDDAERGAGVGCAAGPSTTAGALNASSISSRASRPIASRRLRILLEAAAQQSANRRRASPPAARPVRLALEHERQRVGDVLAPKRALAGQHLVEDDAERPDVAALVDGAARAPARDSCRPRCRGSRRACVIAGVVIVGDVRHARRTTAAVLHRLGQTEVEHLHRAVGPHFDVRGLQVAVDDALLVRGFERFGDLSRDRQRVVERDRPARDALRRGPRPRPAPSRAHATPPAVFEAVDVRDVGVIERRRASAPRAGTARAARDQRANASGRTLIATSRSSFVSRAR